MLATFGHEAIFRGFIRKPVLNLQSFTKQKTYKV